MSQTEFSLDRFENRNGVISWRVSGWLAGVRIRKNLQTREEAAASCTCHPIDPAALPAWHELSPGKTSPKLLGTGRFQLSRSFKQRVLQNPTPKLPDGLPFLGFHAPFTL